MLRVSDLSLGYGQRTLLAKANFRVQQGDLACILGQSGVGKSSLLRILAGLEKAQAGQVELFGQPITQPTADIGFVFQSANLLPWLNVEKNVALGLDFACRDPLSKAEIQKRVQAVLEEVGLADAAKALPSELSGGMAQRVNLARALTRQPKLILLDEPFSALDPLIRSQMQQLLREVIDHHQATAVMVTHDIDEALLIANQILLLGGGKPATVAQQWRLNQPFPRADLRALNHIRLEILQVMQDHSQSLKQQESLEFMI
ncbi:ABC transporter ATP-binding protein [Pasteurellaceae bacterium RH1A]|nr:ABC transporter ATP-binding protein [Pasteurellaceae bacterium RH1A]